MTENPLTILFSQAPSDPAEKDAWAKQMARIQVAMWVDDGTRCAECGHFYASVDDFIERNPRSGYGKGKDNWQDMFVDEACWSEYERQRA